MNLIALLLIFALTPASAQHLDLRLLMNNVMWEAAKQERMTPPPAISIFQMQTTQQALKSAAWGASPINCGTSPTAAGADLVPLHDDNTWDTQNAPPGAGIWPAGYNLTVRKVCVAHYGTFTDGYAVVGHSGPNGDHVSPYLIGKGQACQDYSEDAPIVVTGGEYFDVHANCTSGNHTVTLQIWYTQP